LRSRAENRGLSPIPSDFSEELIRKPDNTVTCPFFIDKNDAQQH